MIIVDSREAVSVPDIFKSLQKHVDAPVTTDTMLGGDYYLSGLKGSVLIERKTITDYAHSLTSGRLMQQLKYLTAAEDVIPLILIEGSLSGVQTFSKMSMSSIIGSLIGIIAGWKIQVIMLPSKRWTSLFLQKLHDKLDGPQVKKIYGVRFKPVCRTMNEKLRCIVEGIQTIGASTADILLTHFGSVFQLAMASVDDLTEVKGIGIKTATHIHSLLRAEYKIKPK